ncbi:MAG: Unknown protein [uncultured Sulfurovum sp.]|uniref:Hemerythrin-like domain-containing protein n=1 Tax=uncultured Sulfurovum sp. TaxID=269237 RepID=A0A6S6U4I8_9BACT|nr:MAG: Unknown protein [uncultured Sulfurovum sp.]
MALVYVEQLEHLDVEQMQETHEKEVKILNEIDKLAIQYSMDKSKVGLLEEKLDAYLAHVKEHFANEERLMIQYDFPSYTMHKTAHDMFLSELDHAVSQWKNFGDIKKIINFVYKSPEWIVVHINTVDAPTSEYLTQKMALEKQDK